MDFPNYKNQIEEIFREAKKINANYFDCCLRDIRNNEFLKSELDKEGIKNSGQWEYRELQKALHTLTNIISFSNYVCKTEQSELHKVYMKLFSYLQCVETKFIYKVIQNLLRVICGNIPKAGIFDNVPSGYCCFESIKSYYADIIVKKNIQFSIFESWNEFIDGNLRNAIAHNDFFINLDEKNISLLEASVNISLKKDIYSFQDVDVLYQKASNFSESFKSIYQEYAPFHLGARY